MRKIGDFYQLSLVLIDSSLSTMYAIIQMTKVGKNPLETTKKPIKLVRVRVSIQENNHAAFRFDRC